MTAYIEFIKAIRPQMKSETPEADFVTVSRLIAAKWKGMSAAEKEPYEKEVARLKAEDPTYGKRKKKEPKVPKETAKKKKEKSEPGLKVTKKRGPAKKPYDKE